VNELDEIIAWVRVYGPVPLPLRDWDQASVWGWDETTGSLYAHLWHNTDDPTGPPAIRVEPDDYTPAITLLPTLVQYIAMAVDRSPWKVITALLKVEDTPEYQNREEGNARVGEAGTVVTMTEGHDIWWPPNFGSPGKGQLKRLTRLIVAELRRN
jgi:hypothetical protein